MSVLEPILGAALILLVLLDVFFTVLYARVNSGIISYYLACWMWRTFRTLSRPFIKNRDVVLSFCGPCILVALVTVWVGGIICGTALIIHPKLGTSVAAQNGPTPRDFATAVYVAGDAITTVGSTEFRPQTPFFRLLLTFGSVIGISMITLVLTYFLEIYNALQSRNTYAVKLQNATGDTGDAAELIAGVGAHGHFEPGYTHLAEMSAEMIHLFESHHFYGVLLYFRFREPYYALSRMALVTLDTATLVKSALDDEEFAWLKESAAIAQLWRSSMQMLSELAMTFLPGGLPDAPEPDEKTIERWRRRYHSALERLRQANIKTIADEQSGAETYIALRAKWDRYLNAFADHMAHRIEHIDTAGANPQTAERRPEFRERLRAAG